MRLYKNLLDLEKKSEAFYHSDQEITINDKTYIIRSFSYRLASCSEFTFQNAKDARGTAFIKLKDVEDKPDNWNLFTRCFPKFWNINECVTKEEFIKDNSIIGVYDKLDGSMISVGKVEDKLITKSKTSINSEQAKMAQEMLDNDENLQNLCNVLINRNHTPMFELVGPSNVIVLRYEKDELIFLGSVHNNTGIVLTPDMLPEDELLNIRKIKKAQLFHKSWDEMFEIQRTCKPTIEGFVVYTLKGMVKVKVNSYCELHKLKDSINNEKSLTKLILDDNLDDLIGSFRDDKDTIDYILSMQEKISKRYNHIVKTVENIINENKDLTRKDFAIKMQREHKDIFGLLMPKYLGKEINYKEFFIKTKMYM